MSRERWACLMLHEVPRAGTASGYFAVPRERFAELLDAIRSTGSAVRSLEDTLADRADRVVALTFDDGHETHYREAFPLLAERGFTATFFVTTSWIGRPGFVSWDELREMAAAGMSIQSHTVTHPFLSELPRDAVERELAQSKAAIEQAIGRRCGTVALPGGDAPRGWNVPDYRRLGYDCVATSRWGPNAATLRGDSGAVVRFVRRYTLRRETPDARVQGLAAAASPMYSLEGLRLGLLHHVRTMLGATRYAAWRRRVLRLLRR